MSSRVYIGRIPRETGEKDLESFFRDFGRIRDVLIKPGYGFVQFDDHRDAEDAVHELHGRRLLGTRVDVEMARGRPRGRTEGMSDRRHRPRQGPLVRTNYRVCVENLSTDVSWQDLKDYLRPAGEVTFTDVHKKYRNEGIAEFATYEDMKNAIREFDDTILKGSRIRLFEDKIRRSRSRSRRSVNSRSSRSRSRSNSLPRKDNKYRDYSRDRSEESRHVSEERERSRYRNKSRSRSNSNSVRRSRSRSRSMSSSEKRFKKTPHSSIESGPNENHP
ncbi:hypothetical protein GWI33_018581 [Rhynchophorus ferrugineus]|uniref:RRM domain-containing protein n=1 Tax=Rhynchophorus ferrugineus TaxID=354439 RepID=A0A834I752_RHYFE|nr:hypothetical protein GWI33_018581 [Rhynchophorus ferrugineus]